VPPTLASSQQETNHNSSNGANSVAAVAAAEGPLELPSVDEYTAGVHGVEVGEGEGEVASPFQTAASVVLTGPSRCCCCAPSGGASAKAKETVREEGRESRGNKELGRTWAPLQVCCQGQGID